MTTTIGIFQNPNSTDILTEKDIIKGVVTKYSLDFAFIQDENGKEWKIADGYYVLYDSEDVPTDLKEILEALDEERFYSNVND